MDSNWSFLLDSKWLISPGSNIKTIYTLIILHQLPFFNFIHKKCPTSAIKTDIEHPIFTSHLLIFKLVPKTFASDLFFLYSQHERPPRFHFVPSRCSFDSHILQLHVKTSASQMHEASLLRKQKEQRLPK